MKKFLINLATLTAVFSLFYFAPVVAQSTSDIVCENIKQVDPNCGNVSESGFVNRIILPIINVLLIVVGAGAALMLVIGGLMYVFSAGDPNNTQRAKDTILYALIGVVVAFSAFAIISFVKGRF